MRLVSGFTFHALPVKTLSQPTTSTSRHHGAVNACLAEFRTVRFAVSACHDLYALTFLRAGLGAFINSFGP